MGERELQIEWDHRTGRTVRVDDTQAGTAPIGQALALSLPLYWESDCAYPLVR